MSVFSPYEENYFSGSQATIFFDEVFVDEINALQYQVASNAKPVFGYASSYYDAVAKGNILVTGSFVINMRHAGYLPIILNHIASQKPKKTKEKWRTRPNSTRDQFENRKKSKSLWAQKAKDYRNRFWAEADKTGHSGVGRFNVPEYQLLPSRPFDIIIAFGDFTTDDVTTHRLYDVRLTGWGQTVEISGLPIQEVYHFLARAAT